MSADNWSICPRCRDRAIQAVEDAKALLLKDYGKISAEEFTRRNDHLRRAELLLNENPALTFREDYEWYGATEGLIQGSYRGSCGLCGLKVVFKVEKQFYPEVSEQ